MINIIDVILIWAVFEIIFFVVSKYLWKQSKKIIIILNASNTLFLTVISLICSKKTENTLLFYIVEICFAEILFYISIEDIRDKSIYSLMVYILIAIGVLGGLANPCGEFVSNILSGVIFFVVFEILFRISKKGIGTADIKTIAAIAFFFGYRGTFRILFMALVLSIIFGIGIMLVKRKNMQYEIAFIPFILLGTLIYMTEMNFV